MTDPETTLDPALLDLPVEGQNLDGARTLGDLVAVPALLVFLRHGG